MADEDIEIRRERDLERYHRRTADRAPPPPAHRQACRPVPVPEVREAAAHARDQRVRVLRREEAPRRPDQGREAQGRRQAAPPGYAPIAGRSRPRPMPACARLAAVSTEPTNAPATRRPRLPGSSMAGATQSNAGRWRA